MFLTLCNINEMSGEWNKFDKVLTGALLVVGGVIICVGGVIGGALGFWYGW